MKTITTDARAGYTWTAKAESFEEMADRLYGCFTGWKLRILDEKFAHIVKENDNSYIVAIMKIAD